MSIDGHDLRVLILHNKYQVAGGEDSVVQAEFALLQENGVAVSLFEFDNREITGFFQKIAVALQTVFSFSSYVAVKRLLRREKPDVVHVHNYFPLMSPSVFYACRSEGVPVVMTLHNYRSICPTALLMYQGRVKERSITGSVWWAVPKKVYRGSLFGTFLLCLMIAVHRFIGTWRKSGMNYIALTNFGKRKYVEAGWYHSRISVKPNFSEDPASMGTHNDVEQPKRRYAIFVGRLSPEKGVDILLDAWKNIGFDLKVIGGGSKPDVEYELDSVEFLGERSKKEVLEYMRHADFLVLPSLCYEGFPMVLAESFSFGLPVLVSDIGSMKEIVEHGVTGLHFEAGNARDLALKAKQLVVETDLLSTMRINARQKYLENYTREANLAHLIRIYAKAIEEGV